MLPPRVISRVRPSYSRHELRAALWPAADSVALFEQELAAHLGVRHALVFTWGRVAIYATLRALKLTGEVVQPAYTSLTVAHASVTAGCRPVFVDAQTDNPNQDPDAMVERVGPETVAVIPASALGVTFDVREMCERIRRRNRRALILLDLCLCFNARWNGACLAEFGDAAVVAFGSDKPITTLDGGALVTNRDDIAEAVRSYRDATLQPPSWSALRRRWLYFVASWIAYSRWGIAIGDVVRRGWRTYVFGAPDLRGSVGLPFDWAQHLPPMAAAIGRVQLRRFGALQRRRTEIAIAYDRRLLGVRGLRLLDLTAPATYGFFYPACVAEPDLRPEVVRGLYRRGVVLGAVWSYLVPDLECYRERGYSAREFPNAVRWSKTIINLPNYPAMTDADVEQTIVSVHAAFRDAMSAPHVTNGNNQR